MGPWHPGLCPRGVLDESIALRAACYCFVAALSMMRDSEIREITRGAVGEFYGAPAVASIKRKHDPNEPREHWWIIDPVAQAIGIAEQLSNHPELIFGSVYDRAGRLDLATTDAGFRSGVVITSFIAHVNDTSDFTGLVIPAGHVAPHMFRKTMAMLAGTEPSSEIALGIQLKHVAVRALANRSTPGYAASDHAWAALLDTELEQARFAHLRELYDEHQAGRDVGSGPAAERLSSTFRASRRQQSPAKAMPAPNTTCCARPASRCASASSTTACSMTTIPPAPNAWKARSCRPATAAR